MVAAGVAAQRSISHLRPGPYALAGLALLSTTLCLVSQLHPASNHDEPLTRTGRSTENDDEDHPY